jgi:hypothetical protein
MEIQNNYCNHLKTIPQFSGTCWFNSIINVMLYSHGFRKTLKKELKGKRKTTDDKFFNFLLYMLRNSNDTDKMAKVYEDFYNLSLKVEYLLYSYLHKYDIPLYNEIKRTFKYGNNQIYIYKILDSYNIKHLDIYHDKYMGIEYILIDKNKKITNIRSELDNIDLLVIAYNRPDGFNIDDMNTYTNSKHNINLKRNINNFFGNVINEIANKATTITINEYSYNLDCCLFGNVNKIEDGGHAIAGITCPNNNKYIIDSINNVNMGEDIYKYKYKKHKKIKTLTPCKPISYDWTIPNRDFCINSSCDNIEFLKNRTDLCYNFSETNIISIYVKNKDVVSPSIDMDIDESSLTSKDFKYKNQKNIIYSDLNKYTISQLEEFIQNKINGFNTNYYIWNINDIKQTPENFCYLYEKLTNKKINLKLHKDVNARIILLNLIYAYLKNGTIYDINNFTDKKTMEIYIKKYLNKPIDYLKTYFDIEQYITSSSSKNKIYDYLFTDNKDFYDKYILALESDREDIKLKHILIKLN